MPAILRALATTALVSIVFAASPVHGKETRCRGIEVECERATDSCFPEDDFDLERRHHNYLIFNHEKGIIEHPVPAELEARDGEVFTILFACTAPQFFDYQIEAIPDDKVSKTTFTSGTQSVTVDELTSSASVTWRHEEEFPLYRVSVTARKPIDKPSTEKLGREAGIEGLRDFEAMMENDPTDEQIRSFATERNLAIDLVRTAAREAETYDLYSYTFPVWVRTVGWKLSFSSGFAFSGLENPKFFLETVEPEDGAMNDGMPMDGMGDPMDPMPAEEVKIVRRDRAAQDDFRPDLMALANLQFPSDLHQYGDGGWGWLKPFGISFGVGIGEDSEPRYFFGPSWNLGEHFVLTGGVAGGKVETLPVGQKLDQPAINGDSTLSTLPKHFETTWFAGIAFRFRPAEKEFLGALSGVQKVDDGKEGDSKDGDDEDEETESAGSDAQKNGKKSEPTASMSGSEDRWSFESCIPLAGAALSQGPELSGLAVAGSELVAPFEDVRALAFVSPSGSVRQILWGGGGEEAEIEGIAHYQGRYYLIDECEPKVYRVDLAAPGSPETLAISADFGIQRELMDGTCQGGLEGIAFDPEDGTVFLMDERDEDNLKRMMATIYVGRVVEGKILPAETQDGPYRFPLSKGWRFTDITFHSGDRGPELLGIASTIGAYRVMSIPLTSRTPRVPAGEAELVADLTEPLSRKGCKNPNLEGLTVGTQGDLFLVSDAKTDEAETTFLVRLVPPS